MIGTPGLVDSARLAKDFPEPEPEGSDVLVETVLVGLCGSDRELLRRTGSLEPSLVVGHESLARVISSPEGSAFGVGDLVVGMVRRPCLNACRECRQGRLDNCETLPPTERGLFGLDGFGADRWTSAEQYLVPVPAGVGDHGVLLEPLTCVVKARRRLVDMGDAQADRILVTGAGTIGLLAAWAFSRGRQEVVVCGRRSRTAVDEAISMIPRANFNLGIPPTFDGLLAIEASGSAQAALELVRSVRPGGTVLLLGVYAEGVPDELLRLAVLRNITIVGSVSASREDHTQAASELLEAPPGLLSAIIGEEIDPIEWPAWAAGSRVFDAIKTVVRF